MEINNDSKIIRSTEIVLFIIGGLLVGALVMLVRSEVQKPSPAPLTHGPVPESVSVPVQVSEPEPKPGQIITLDPKSSEYKWTDAAPNPPNPDRCAWNHIKGGRWTEQYWCYDPDTKEILGTLSYGAHGIWAAVVYGKSCGIASGEYVEYEAARRCVEKAVSGPVVRNWDDKSNWEDGDGEPNPNPNPGPGPNPKKK